jgi:hypothetical protein
VFVYVNGLTPNEKGGIAEVEIAAAATRAGYRVSRPIVEGGRYDLIFDSGTELLRVQCKWGRQVGDVIQVRTGTSRHTPLDGYVTTKYTAAEVDAIAVYCADLDQCYLIPIAQAAGKTYLYLRVAPARNNQQIGVTMADDYRLGAVAQLGERRAGSAKVRGSSPLSSTGPKAA